MTTEEAVEVLTSDRPSRFLFEREFAIATFSGWVNSPHDPSAAISTAFMALNRAVFYARHHNITPPVEWIAEIFDAESYLKLLNHVITMPFFWDLECYDNYNDCRYAGDIVRFLLTFRSKEPDKRKRASLGKAWEFINKHGGYVRGNFGHGKTEWCSISNHQTLWRSYKQSAPFQCARFHCHKFDWYIDPRSANFLENLTIVAARQQEIKDHFCAVLDLQERMRLIIDPRSMSSEDYFKFPLFLKPLECRLPAMTASAYGKMATYRRSTNLSTPEWD